MAPFREAKDVARWSYQAGQERMTGPRYFRKLGSAE